MVCAIEDGKRIDTSFGMSLQSGLIHATRVGGQCGVVHNRPSLPEDQPLPARGRGLTPGDDRGLPQNFWPFPLDIGVGFTEPADNIDEIALQGNTLCTEAQDALSLGVLKLPEWITPRCA